MSDPQAKSNYALLIKKLRSFLRQQEIVEVVKKIDKTATVRQSTISSWERGSVNFITQYQSVGVIGGLFGYKKLEEFKKILNSSNYTHLITKYTPFYWGIKLKSYLLQENDLIEIFQELTKFNPDVCLKIQSDRETRMIKLSEMANSHFSRFLRHLRGSFSQLAFSDWLNSCYPLVDVEVTQEWVSSWEQRKRSNSTLPSHVFEMLSTFAGVPYPDFLAYLDGNQPESILRFYGRSLDCNQLILLGKSLVDEERKEILAHLSELIKLEQGRDLVQNPLQELISNYLREMGMTWDDLIVSAEPYGLSKADINRIKEGSSIPFKKAMFLWAAIASPNGTTYFKREVWNQAVEQTFSLQ
jgi:hypothetical protein